MKRVFRICLAMCVALTSSAAEYYVANTAAANDAPGYGLTPDTPFLTIAYAVTQVPDNSVIHVAAGEYKPSGTIMIDHPVSVIGAGVGQSVLNGSAIGTATRMLAVDSAEAVFEGFTFSNCNFTVSDSGSDRYGTVAYLKAGTIRACRFTSCRYNGYKNHGVVCNDGGLLDDCEIDGCSVGTTLYMNRGLALCQLAGTSRNCHIRNNPSVATYGNVYVGGGVLRNSRIAFNGASNCALEGTGVRIHGGIVENCLIRGNTNNNLSAGVFIQDGTLRHCTITENMSVGTYSGNSGVRQTGGTVVNNIIWGNGPAGATFGSVEHSGGSFATNLVDKALTVGTGVIDADPLFADAANGDYQLMIGSPAIDAAALIATVTNDFSGAIRPQGAAPELGHLEYMPSSGALKAGFTVSRYDYPQGGEATFIATPEGANLAGLSYAWHVDGGETAVGTATTFIWSDLQPGVHAVKLVVANANETNACERVSAIVVHPFVTFVSTNGANAFPYTNWATAATSPNAAVAALWNGADATGTVVFAAGAFALAAPLTLDRGFALLGAGRDVTILTGGAYNGRGVVLSHPAALVADLTIQDVVYELFNAAGSGGGVRMTAGTVRNCHVKNCTLTTAYQYGSLVYMTDGLLDTCELDGGILGWSVNARGNALYQGGGTVTNCHVHHNQSIGTLGGAGAYVEKGLNLCNRYEYNGTTSAGYEGSGLRVAGGLVQNCLIRGNTNKSSSAGAHISAGRMEHCTIVGNIAVNDVTGKSGLYQTGGDVVNCIVYGNGPAGSTYGSSLVTGGSFMTNIVDKAVDGAVGGAVGDPIFKDAAGGDYRLAIGSPAIDTAAPLEGATGDIAGVTRPQGAAPDIGCYEYVPGSSGFVAGIVIASTDVPVGSSPFATCAVEGAPGETVDYAWYLDGAATPASTSDTLVWTNAPAGLHHVRLVVTSGGQSITNDLADAFNVHPFVTYASLAGANMYPYTNWATAATSVNDALLALWSAEGATGAVILAEGTYPLTDMLSLSRAFRLHGAGRDQTILKGGAYSSAPGIYMTHADAVVEHLTISNMVYSLQESNANGAGVAMSAGTVRDCHITRCKTVKAYQSGSGLYIAGGLVVDSEIDHCWEDWAYNSRGNAVYQTGGVVSNCWIHHNPTPCQTGGAGVGLWGGLMTACRIEANGTTTPKDGSHDGVGVYVQGGTLRNTLVIYNTNTTANAGVKVADGRMEHCTVYGNISLSTSTANSGLVQTGGTVVNCIVYGNGSQYEALGSSTVSGGTFATNLVDLAIASGVGCLVVNPGFADIASDDFHLKLGSPAMNTAAPIAGVTDDLDGVARPQGDAPDIGCYEYVSTSSDLVCGILSMQTHYPLGASPTATAMVEGADLEGLVYHWYLDGSDTPTASGATFVWPGTASAGRHDLLLVVMNAGGEHAEAFVPDVFNVHPFIAYVSNAGSGAYPYDTAAKATSNVVDAFSAIWNGETTEDRALHLAAGVYKLTDTILLARPVAVIGAGRRDTIITGTNLNKRAFVLTDDGARLEGFTLMGVRTGISQGGSIYLSKGTIRDCRVTGSRGTTYLLHGLGVYMTGGLLENTLLDNLVYTDSNPWTTYNSDGAGLYLAGGTVRGCTISNCVSGTSSPLPGLAVRMTGGLIENTRITRNGTATWTSSGAGVYLTGGTLRNCLVDGNQTTQDGVGIYGAGNIVNCTIVSNLGSTVAAKLTNGSVVNTICWGNAGGDLAYADVVSVTYSCWSECASTRDGNFSADPLFEDAAALDWRLSLCSPCVNAGDNAVWLSEPDATDIAGLGRITGGRVDLGCLEQHLDGLLIILR